MAAARASDHTFFATSALLFAISVAVTAAWCKSMAGMGAMPMPGGWTMSMAWMRMPGQSWPEALASFLAMWIVMMAAMMLPSLVPALNHYRKAMATRGADNLNRLTALVGLGYLFVWTVLGVALFPVGALLAETEMNLAGLARAVPGIVAGVVLLAGTLQFSEWKLRHLSCCRRASDDTMGAPAGSAGAFRHGMRLGIHCSLSCANLTTILLALGVMDLSAMALVTAAITAERLAPWGERVARASGIAIVALGILLAARAIPFP